MATPTKAKSPVTSTVVPPAPPTEAPSGDFEESPVKPTIIMTETDAYIHERMVSQPKTLDEVRRTVVQVDTSKNRLSLPDYFERFSYDCTVGRGCKSHIWSYDESTNRWSYPQRGEFIFRWMKNTKRAIDHALNVSGWFFVNRRYFPEAPSHLFSANGGIELGDVILFFLPAKQALALRAAPGKRSTETIRSRVTRVKAGEVLMAGDPSDERFYQPESGTDTDTDATAPGLVEGRDF